MEESFENTSLTSICVQSWLRRMIEKGFQNNLHSFPIEL